MPAKLLSAGFITALVLLTTCGAYAAPATRPSARPTTQQTRSLVDLLSSDDWKVRQKAMDDLTALGPLAEAELRQRLKTNPDPDTTAAIEALLAQIAEAGKISPTLITLHLKSVAAKDAAAAIAREAHIEFVPGVESLLAEVSGAIDLDLDRTPMWQAVQELCSRTHLTFSETNASGQIVLVPITPQMPPPPLATAGPFLLAVSRLEVTTSYVRNYAARKPMNGRSSSSDAVPGCSLIIFPYCEPRLNVIYWFIDSIDESVADTGKIEHDKAIWGNRGRISTAWSDEVRLGIKAPPGATKIVHLKLMTRFVLQQETQKLEIPDILSVKNGTYMLGGFRLVIKGVHKVGENRYAYDLEINRDGHSEAEWSLFGSLLDNRGCSLVDADGEPLGGVGGGGGGAPGKITRNYTLTRDKGNGKQTGEPVKLVWEVPSKTQQIIVPMEFHDIELPK